MGGYGGLGEGGIGGGGGLPPITVEPPGSSGAGAGISGALASIINYIGGLDTWQTNRVNALFGGLGKSLENIFGSILDFLKHLKDTWLGHLIGSIWDRVKKIYKSIAGAIKKIICILQAYEDLVTQYEDKILKPIINLIQRVRRVLLIFRIFHFKFAERLDNYLRIQEAKLARIFLFQRRWLNYVIDYLNLIVDPFGLFNEGMYVKSALRSIGDLFGALWGAQNRPLGSSDAKAQAQMASSLDRKNINEYGATVVKTGLPPTDLATIDQIARAFAGHGYVV